MSGRQTGQADQSVRDEAIAWLTRVQSDAATGEDWTALTDWLEASEAHQAAFETVEVLVSDIDVNAGEIDAALSPPRRLAAPAHSRRRAPDRRRAFLLSGLAAAVGVVIVAPIAWRASEGEVVAYRTGPGEMREIKLADGTHIHLDAASRLTVRLGWRERRVKLGDAVAAFDVAKDPNRPFVIGMGDQQVRVVGTEFNISHYAKTSVVTVRRGVVEVRQPQIGPQPVAVLKAGDELTHVQGAATSHKSAVNPNVAFAWSTGRLICEERPLSEIVAYLNHRYATKIRLSGAVGQRRFSGVLELGAQADVVRRLAAYLDLKVHRNGREITLS